MLGIVASLYFSDADICACPMQPRWSSVSEAESMGCSPSHSNVASDMGAVPCSSHRLPRPSDAGPKSASASPKQDIARHGAITSRITDPIHCEGGFPSDSIFAGSTGAAASSGAARRGNGRDCEAPAAAAGGCGYNSADEHASGGDWDPSEEVGPAAPAAVTRAPSSPRRATAPEARGAARPSTRCPALPSPSTRADARLVAAPAPGARRPLVGRWVREPAGCATGAA